MSWGWRQRRTAISSTNLKLKSVMLKIYILQLTDKDSGWMFNQYEIIIHGVFITQCSIWMFHHRKAIRSFKPNFGQNSYLKVQQVRSPIGNRGDPEDCMQALWNGRQFQFECCQQNAAGEVTVEDRAGDERDGLLWHRFSITRNRLWDRASCRRSASINRSI